MKIVSKKRMPLSGIKILDLTRYLPFSYGSMLLGDMGAEVIKIEEPSKGDYQRLMYPLKKKEGYVFLSTNRNKKSITLNLKKDEGKKVFFRLAKSADVIFESFRPGVVKKLGIDYETIKKISPQLIYCSCTGYGQTGPYSQRPGHDINYLGVSGILGVTGRETGSPVIPGIPIADMTAGVFSALAISAVLVGQRNCEEGCYIDVSMTDCMVSYMHIYNDALFGKSRRIDPSTGGSIRYNTFKTKDGKFITIGNLEDKFWFNFCDLIGREDLKKYGFETKKEHVYIMEELRNVFHTKTRQEWLTIMNGRDICYGPVNETEEVLEDPQIKHRGMYSHVDHPVEGKIGQISFPIKFSKFPQIIKYPPPRLGEHTEEVLRETGYTTQEIKQLRVLSII